MNAEGIHDVCAVNRNGVGAQVEGGGNFLVRFAVNDHLQDLEFALCQGRATLTAQSSLLLDFGIENGFSSGDFADQKRFPQQPLFGWRY